MSFRVVLRLFLPFVLLSAYVTGSQGQSTAFMYQGQLNVAGVSANGKYDLCFGLFLANSGGVPVGNLITNLDVPVTNGVFAAMLNYGNVFNGASYWLEIGVRTNGGTNGFTTLAPRQFISSAPYATAAGNLTQGLPAFQLTGTLPAGVFPAALPPLNGFSLTNVNVASLAGIISSNNLPPNLQPLTVKNGGNLTNLSYHVYNVRDFGAGGGNPAVDSAAFRAVMNVWTNQGGTIYLPPGDYYDTNLYYVQTAAGVLPVMSAFPLNIVGAGSEVTHWHFFGTNATWWRLASTPQLVKGICFIAGNAVANTAISSLPGAGDGGTNNCFWDVGQQGHRIMEDVGFLGFMGIGCNFNGEGASAYLSKIQFWNAGTGISLAGYSDDTMLSVVGYHCTNAVVDLGQLSQPDNNKQVHGAHIDIFGANNNIGVIVGGGAAYSISGYTEDTTNSIVMIGHSNLSDFGVGSVAIENLGFLQYGDGRGPEVLCQIYTPPTLLTVRNIEAVSTANIVSMNAASDLTPVISEIVGTAPVMVFSDGTSVPNTYPVTYINIAQSIWQKGTGTLTQTMLAGAQNYSFSATNAALDTNGNFKSVGNFIGGKSTLVVASGSTANINAAIRYQDFNVSGSVTFALVNLGLIRATNAATISLLIYPGFTACVPKWPAGWIWENEAGTASAPANIPGGTLLHVVLTMDVQPSVTNIFAHATSAGYTP